MIGESFFSRSVFEYNFEYGNFRGESSPQFNVLVTPYRRMIYPLLQGSLKVRHALRTTPEPHLLAQVIPAVPADAAVAAGDAYFQRHSVSYLEAGHYNRGSQ